jgi:DNA (cytosine-5)-methyltransferase 1
LVDLFAGIGGFSLAAHQFGITTDVFVEKEPYPQKLLAQNFPDVPIVDDIFNFNSKFYEELTGYTSTDIVSGGFPCQPFSLAGQRKGTEDNRYLWGEMCRVIQELNPRWVIAENVYGIVNIQEGLVFETVHTDLEAQGYEVQTFIIPASSKNAPHRRDRVWFVAHSDKNSKSVEPINEQKRMDVTNSDKIRCRGFSQKECRIQEWNIHKDKSKGCEVGSETDGRCDTVTNPNSEGFQRRKNKRSIRGIRKKFEKQSSRLLCRNWKNFPTQSPVCGRDDGISNRVDRIKALGNAIVPQVAMEIFRTIIEVEMRKIT